MNIKILKDLRSTISSARDQGERSTCLAHSISASHENRLGIKDYLSPEYLHFFSTKGNPKDSSSFESSQKVLKNKGQPLEIDCPYFDSDPPSDWKPSNKLKVYTCNANINTNDHQTIWGALDAGKIPVIGIDLTDSFFAIDDPWIIFPESGTRGRHAVTVVGCGERKTTRFFLIRNSWGVDWGFEGHAWLQEEYVIQNLQRLLILEN